MSTVIKVPRQLTNKEETFQGLCKDFDIDKKVEVLLLAFPMENLEDMRSYFDDDADVRIFVASDVTIKDGQLRLQTARVRAARHAYCTLARKRDDGRATHVTMDLDDPHRGGNPQRGG